MLNGCVFGLKTGNLWYKIEEFRLEFKRKLF